MMHSLRPRRLALELLLLGILVFCVVVPLASIVCTISADDFMRIIASRSFKRAFWNSLSSASLATLISVSLAGLVAWALVRTRMPFKRTFTVLITIPMLIPSLSHGMGLILLFGSNGILTRLFGLETGIYGFCGVITGSVLYSFPVALLMVADILRYEDRSGYEAAAVLGIPKGSQFLRLTLPYMARPLISVCFAVFALIVTDYGVPLMVGGKFSTLPVLMYQETIGLLNFSKGGVIGLVLLAPAVAAFIMDTCMTRQSASAFGHRAIVTAPHPLRDRIATALCTVTSAVVLLPIAAFAILSLVRKYPIDLSFSLRNIEQALHMGAAEYAVNALIVATAASVIGVVFATVIAYFAARSPSRLSRLTHFTTILTLAIPGVVLGLGYILAFNGTAIYGTLAILIMVNSVHFLASPYLMMYNSFEKMNPHLEAVGATLGVPRLRIFLDVLLPLGRATQIEMFAYLFVNCMMTISAVSFLSTVENRPLALMINQFEAQMMLEAAAFVSVLILAVNLTVKALALAAQRRFGS